ncbi:chromatin assembly factor 1 subunit b [Anaeramoeba flamelloides]|uniref:Chromatin assembly factor 1 subunit b n=1 Tax=Anaeramoeba flamelloides TaxID=1746091 RepID=A0ABQ8ZBE3_9EUKA|nr:chromatin assembly factor 1 subunit b [Anaeramoeba flamelloides]
MKRYGRALLIQLVTFFLAAPLLVCNAIFFYHSAPKDYQNVCVFKNKMVTDSTFARIFLTIVIVLLLFTSLFSFVFGCYFNSIKRIFIGLKNFSQIDTVENFLAVSGVKVHTFDNSVNNQKNENSMSNVSTDSERDQEKDLEKETESESEQKNEKENENESENENENEIENGKQKQKEQENVNENEESSLSSNSASGFVSQNSSQKELRSLENNGLLFGNETFNSQKVKKKSKCYWQSYLCFNPKIWWSSAIFVIFCCLTISFFFSTFKFDQSCICKPCTTGSNLSSNGTCITGEKNNCDTCLKFNCVWCLDNNTCSSSYGCKDSMKNRTQC